jgi:hypothetical protein
MSGHEVLEPLASGVKEPIRSEQGANESVAFGRWPLDRPFPALLTDADLIDVFGVSPATFYRWKAKGRFKRFETSPQLSERFTYYSGALVRSYCLAQWTEARTFGGKRGPRSVQTVSRGGITLGHDDNLRGEQ